MKITLTPELEAFREHVSAWLKANAIESLRGIEDRVLWEVKNTDADEWRRRVGEAGWICASWPKEYGGGGLTGAQVAILNEEFAQARMPRVVMGMGEGLVGPAIIGHATEEQKRYFLPRIISGEDWYCQGFSEPNAGSDLAGLQTKAEIVGDEVIVTGQKTWTTRADAATMIFCLCRTDPKAPKHKGISYVLVPMDERVTVRPIREITEGTYFSEVFLDGARAPLFNVIGGLNNGWHVAMTTLAHERGSSATVQHLMFAREFWRLAEMAGSLGRRSDPLVRQRLAWAYTHVELMRYTGVRVMARLVAGRGLGPEASVNKLFWSEYHRSVSDAAMSILGTAGTAWPAGDDAAKGWPTLALQTRGETIYAGTSEIQRNIIAERVLGLPREPDGQR